MTHTVLIVSSDQADAELLQKTLASARDGPFDTEWLQSLQEALARLGQGGIDVILVDLFLSDSKGMATFDTLFALVPPIPIMVISQEDEDLSIEAVKSGAQGYLSKGHLRHSLIPQALKTMIQRKQIEQALYIEHERAQVTLESIGDGVLSTDAEMNITYLNPEAERMTGWSRVEAWVNPLRKSFS